MTAEEYQKKAHEFAFYAIPVTVKTNNMHGMHQTVKVDEKLAWTYPALALAEESGELCGKLAKALRDNGGHITPEKKLEISKEAGDVLWELAEICTCLGLSLEDVMEQNIKKLEDRKNRNVLSGSGDNR